MEFLGLNPCKADPDIWMQKAKQADNTDYWENVLLYVDDCLYLKRLLEMRLGIIF